MNSPPKVDYERLAARFDDHRRWGRAVPGRILELAEAAPAVKESAAERRPFLEVGCGTGGATKWFSRLWPGPVAGLDKSREMLRRAREKLPFTPLVRADAVALPFRNNSFVGAAALFVLHHLHTEARRCFFRELRRTVVPGGRVMFATVDHEQILNHVLTRWFPKLAETDTARFPDVPVLEEELRAAGGGEIGREVIMRQRPIGDAAYLERVKGRFISTLELLDEEEFRAGVRRMEKELAEKGHLGDVSWYGTLLWATLS